MFGKKITRGILVVLIGWLPWCVLTNHPFSPACLHLVSFLFSAWLESLLMFYLYNILNLNQLYTRCPESDSIRKLLTHIYKPENGIRVTKDYVVSLIHLHLPFLWLITCRSEVTDVLLGKPQGLDCLYVSYCLDSALLGCLAPEGHDQGHRIKFLIKPSWGVPAPRAHICVWQESDKQEGPAAWRVMTTTSSSPGTVCSEPGSG